MFTNRPCRNHHGIRFASESVPMAPTARVFPVRTFFGASAPSDSLDREHHRCILRSAVRDSSRLTRQLNLLPDSVESRVCPEQETFLERYGRSHVRPAQLILR